ncbi:Plipastatin synthase subunit D [compost metagenome]
MDLRLPEIDGLGIKPVDPAFYRAKFDLTLWAEEEENSIRLMLEYRTGLFKKETAENMLQDLKRIIEVWIDNPQMQLGGIDLRTEEEKEQQQKRMMELEAALEMDFDL